MNDPTIERIVERALEQLEVRTDEEAQQLLDALLATQYITIQALSQ